MRREELIQKGYTEEQVKELLNMFHEEQNQIKENNSKLIKDLENANAQISTYKEKEKSQLTEQEKLEQTRKEIEEHLANARLIESKASAKTIFAEIGGVSDDVLNSTISTDLSKTEANAKAIVELIKSRDEQITKKTKESLLNNNVLPKSNSNVNPTGESSMTKEEFKNLTIQEKTKLFRENRELWNKITQQ